MSFVLLRTAKEILCVWDSKAKIFSSSLTYNLWKHEHRQHLYSSQFSLQSIDGVSFESSNWRWKMSQLWAKLLKYFSSLARLWWERRNTNYTIHIQWHIVMIVACLSVDLSVRICLHILETTRPRFAKFYIHITYGHDSFFLTSTSYVMYFRVSYLQLHTVVRTTRNTRREYRLHTPGFNIVAYT